MPCWCSRWRYILKIHFFIESGRKMIQFKIQFKTKSRIFIQKNIYQIGQWASLGGGRLTIAVRAAMRHSRTRAGRTRIRGPVGCGVEQQAEMPPPAHDDLHCTRSSGQGLARTILLPRQVGGFWPIGMLQLVPAGFIHPLAANNLSIESRRCDQIFCAYSDESG